MADANKLESDARIVQKQETVEVITGDGKNLTGSKNLDSIFDKIEAGTHNAEDAIKEVMTSKPEPQKEEPALEPAKKEEVPVKEETPTEEKTLDGALDKAEKDKDPIVVPPKGEEDVSEDDLRVLAHDKPKTAKRISALLGKVTKATEEKTLTVKERDEQVAKVKELEAKLAGVQTVDPATQAAIDEQLKELVQYRRRYELEKDPEVQTRFDARIKGSDEAVTATLKRHGAGEGLLKTIQDEGGWEAFADSKKLIPLKGEDEPITAAELAKRILESLPYSEQRAINSAIDQKHTARREKEQYFSDETKKAADYFSQREEMTKQQQAVLAQQQQDYKKTVDDFQSKLDAENEWLKEKPIPAGATPEQRAAIEDDNKWAKQINGERKKYSDPKGLTDILATIGDAVKYHHERHQVAKLTAKVAKLEQELDTVRSAGKTTKKQGSIAGGSSAAADVIKPKAARSLEDAFTMLEAGKDPNED